MSQLLIMDLEKHGLKVTMKSEIAKGLMLNLNINAYNNKYNAPNGEPQSIDGMIGYAVRQGPIYAGQKSDGSFGYQDNYIRDY
jgi:hypothetical protein